MERKERSKDPKKDNIEDMYDVDSWRDLESGFNMDFTLKKIRAGVGMTLPTGLGEIIRMDRRLGIGGC